MNTGEFKNLKDLYKKITPALNSKVGELNIQGFDYIKKEDVWNYLSLKKWKNSNDLTLYDMVDDIFNLEKEEINSFVLNILNKEKREVKEFNEDVL